MSEKKSDKANLENKRGMFLQIGIIVSLSIVFLAFEWTTVENQTINWERNGNHSLIEEMTEITVHKTKPPKMPKPKIIQKIEFVDDKNDIDTEIEISVEVTDETKNELDFIIEEEPDETLEEPVVFISAEKQPEFPGGLGAMYKYLADHLKYPQIAKEAGIQGTVYISFIVWNDGSIRDVSLIRGIGGDCDEEAMRVIQSMPNWLPGMQRTQAVNVKMNLPVVFKLLK